MYVLTQRFCEPEVSGAAYTLEITAAEAERLQGVLDWLKEHAKEDYGHTLSAWKLSTTEISEPADIIGIEDTLSMIALESRYNELDEPGEYYGAHHPDLDGR